MRILSDHDSAALAEAAQALRAGAVVVLPTETVYGLAARADDPAAISRVFATKGRPSDNPLIVHCARPEQALCLLAYPAPMRRLAAAFWPGPLTLVAPAAAGIPVADAARANLATIAVRVPASAFVRDLIEAVGVPLVMPSANRSGRLSPTTAAAVMHDYADATQRPEIIIDGGACTIGVESTVIGYLEGGWRLLREGGIAVEKVEEVLAAPVYRATSPVSGIAHSPGQLHRHYAPARARVVIGPNSSRPGDAIMGFDGTEGAVLDLSPTGDPAEAAQRLYHYLAILDQAGFARIIIPQAVLSRLSPAVRDRLQKAADNGG